jgi:hypothetical protein
MSTSRAILAAACVLGLILASGCASDVANRYYSTTQYPPKNPREVQILSTTPNRPFEVIADFQSRGESAESIRKKAAKIGADAVIIAILGGRYSTREEWAENDRHEGTYSRITGTAIRYTER